MTPENQTKLVELEEELFELASMPVTDENLDRRRKELLEEIRLIVKKNRNDNFLIDCGLDLERYSVEGGDDDNRFLLDSVTGRRYMVSTCVPRDQVREILAGHTS